MFGVIVCPHCTLVLGADLDMTRVTCPRCGGKVDVRKAKVYFSTDSSKELAEAVRQVGERLVYDIESPGPPAPVKRGPYLDESLWAQALKVTESVAEFTREDMAVALSGASDRDVDRILSTMLAGGLIYEATVGRYRPA